MTEIQVREQLYQNIKTLVQNTQNSRSIIEIEFKIQDFFSFQFGGKQIS
jgi:hypothetical protein